MLTKLIRTLSNLPGWSTNRKIVVLESDDWGSLRMPSVASFAALERAGLSLGKENRDRYNKFDTLASKQDLTYLFETLSSVKDSNNNAAKLTAISLVANPDFNKIKETGYTKYFYEPFTKTLDRYNMQDAFAMWQEGYRNNIFVPEFHGREHLNIMPWLRALQSGDKEALLAFEHEVWGYNRKNGIGFQAAFDLEFSSDLEVQKEIVADGLKLFENLHGYKANFFVPPNGPVNNALEEVAAKNGVQYMSTPKIQKEVLGEGRTRKHFRYIGKKNKHNQIYITRNAFFEPSGSSKNEVDICLSQIELAFKYKKPAVVSTHRVNFIGGLNVENRDKSLKQLNQLLTSIIKKWPDVEFMTSAELGNTIKND